MQRTNPTDGIDIIGCDDARTIPGLFYHRLDRDPEGVAYSEFHEGQWKDFTWNEIGQRVALIRAALDRAGMASGDRVAIALPNSVDWVAFDIAAMANGLIVVPLYLNDSFENSSFILSDSGARLCIIDTGERWSALEEYLVDNQTLEHVWIRDCSAETVSSERREVSSLATVLYEGEMAGSGIRCLPDDVATIIYTSGTTGRPKGAMLTHHAILWNAEATTKFIPPLKSDIFLSLLPLAHAFERTIGYYLPMMGGCRIAYARSIDTLRDDIRTIRPTVLVAVPRLYERISDAVQRQAAESPLQRILAEKTASIGWRLFEAERGRASNVSAVVRMFLWPLLQRIVARRILQAFGGRLRVALSGGAPLSTNVSHFLIGLGLPLVEGYGLTEAAPVVTATSFEDNQPGSVGRPLEGVEVKLTQSGELLVKSPSVMKGYWNNREKTAVAMTEDGWLRTGDIAELRGGRVFITGRVKDLIVLSTGENVAPSAIEAAIERDNLFDQACVIGNDRPCLIAIVVLNPQEWARFAREQGLTTNDLNTNEAKATILSRITKIADAFSRFAAIRGIHATTQPWSVEDGTLTPTLKIKRHLIEQRYRTEIDDLFTKIAVARTSGNTSPLRS